MADWTKAETDRLMPLRPFQESDVPPSAKALHEKMTASGFEPKTVRSGKPIFYTDSDHRIQYEHPSGAHAVVESYTRYQNPVSQALVWAKPGYGGKQSDFTFSNEPKKITSFLHRHALTAKQKAADIRNLRSAHHSILGKHGKK